MNITVPINRKRFPHVLVISSLMICFLIYDAGSKAKESAIEEPESWIVYAFIIAVLAYYAIISLIEYFKTLFDRNASLIITDMAIVDNLSIFSCGKISRTDIKDVEVKGTLFGEFLVIKLEDPFKYLQGKNLVQKRVLRQYIKKFGSPIVISDQRVEYNLHELKSCMLESNG